MPCGYSIYACPFGTGGLPPLRYINIHSKILQFKIEIFIPFTRILHILTRDGLIAFARIFLVSGRFAYISFALTKL